MKKYAVMAVILALTAAVIPVLFNAAFSDIFPARGEKEIELTLTENGGKITLSAEDYLIGCLFAQIDVSYEEEALKAQACAAYTYALRLLEGGNTLSDSTSLCQPYFTPAKAKEYYGESYGEYLPKIKEAAAYGASHVIYYENKPIYSVYHSVSAGATTLPVNIWGIQPPYLTRKACPADRNFFQWSASNQFTPEDIRQKLLKYDSELQMPLDYSKWFTNTVKDESGYVVSVDVGGKTLSGGDVWRILKLRSAAFDIRWDGMAFSVSTSGFGHGVGMSQYTANEMAKSGKTAEEILLYFYEGCRVKIL